jgi:hypothetical protein
VPPPQQQGVHQHEPLAGLQNPIGQNLNFIFGNAAGDLNLNELPAPAVPAANGMPDLNALPHQLNADDFLELNDLLNPGQQEAVNLQDVEMHLGRSTDARKIGDWKSALREADAAIAAGADSSQLVKSSSNASVFSL